MTCKKRAYLHMAITILCIFFMCLLTSEPVAAESRNTEAGYICEDAAVNSIAKNNSTLTITSVEVVLEVSERVFLTTYIFGNGYVLKSHCVFTKDYTQVWPAIPNINIAEELAK
jgi:hypothetical protein